MVIARALSFVCLTSLSLALVSVASAEDVSQRLISWQPDVATAWTDSQTKQQPMLLYVKTEGCFYCTKMERETYASESVARCVSDGFIATSVDQSTIPELVKKLGIRVYPTTVIIAPNAQVLDSISGYVSAKDLQPRLDAAAKRAETTRR